jgi:hypothetical protein
MPSRAGRDRRELGAIFAYALPEGERVSLGSRLEEHDLQRPLAYLAGLPHKLVKATLAERAVPVLVDVDTVCLAGSIAIEEDAKRDRRSCSG